MRNDIKHLTKIIIENILEYHLRANILELTIKCSRIAKGPPKEKEMIDQIYILTNICFTMTSIHTWFRKIAYYQRYLGFS